MTVKILIRRTIPKENETELMPLLKQLRNLGVNQPGYISGETLKNINNPNEILVISTWQSAEQWQAWVQNEKRREIQDQIEFMLAGETDYNIYTYV
jgi:heme-degrading monooxygenase HmoA